MIITLLTSTLDIMFCYPKAKPFQWLCLYFGAMIHLTSRLLLFSTILSMQPEGERSGWGNLVIACFFLISIALTMALRYLFDSFEMYHHDSQLAAEAAGDTFEWHRRKRDLLLGLASNPGTPSDATLMTITVSRHGGQPGSVWSSHDLLDLFGSEQPDDKAEHSQELTLQVSETWTIGKLKEDIQNKWALPIEKQFLVFVNRELEDSHYTIDEKTEIESTLKHYRIKNGDTIHLMKSDHEYDVSVSVVFQDGFDPDTGAIARFEPAIISLFFHNPRKI
jgi:hypothetical protein